ncbi:MAG: ABC transporter permease [Clostridia bacterium]|nr:ABC transporter permease [Clostridia bacterium]
MIGDLVRLTFKNFHRRRLRSLLTVAGIAVGTLLVTMVSFLGSAGQSMVGKELTSMGLNGISISSGTEGGLKEDTLHTVRSMKLISEAMPLSIHFTTADIGRFDGDVMACGIDAGADQVISLSCLYGRMLSKGDISGCSAVCVVDEALATDAYGRKNIVGKTLYLQSGSREEKFTVVGVSKAGSSVLQNVTGYMPTMVYFPYTTLRDLTGVTTFDQIAVRVNADTTNEDARIDIKKMLERQDLSGTEFVLEDLAAQRDKLNGLMDIVRVVLQVISAISLLVAGMSIMTIMLVSVHERTVEIGIKKAIGATGGRIMLEFMAEALMLTLAGSIAGSAVAVVACVIGGAVTGMEIGVSLSTILAVTAFSLVLGIVFGVYPAKKAAALPPAEALRGG